MYILGWIIFFVLTYYVLNKLFLKHQEKNNVKNNVIYVLDRLLQVCIDGEAIKKSRNIDLSLYQLLNTWDINQRVFHERMVLVTKDEKAISQEDANFLSDLLMYMEYDINTSYFWTMTLDNQSAQKKIHENIIATRKRILYYLNDKQLITDEKYKQELEVTVKPPSLE